MRSYSNFLLFEDVLTNLPAGSDIILQAANTLVNPTVQIVETDCGTLLGSIVPLTYAILGRMELTSGLPLTETSIANLLNQGVSTVRVRSVPTCISKNGICSTCYTASYGVVGASVGSFATLSSELVYKTDIIVGDGVNSSYPVTQNSSQYTKTNLAGGAYYPEVLSLTDSLITFNSVRTTFQTFALEYYMVSTDPLLEYIAKSYSGSLLGLSPLPSYQLLIKPSLYQSLFSDSQVYLLRDELNLYSKNIPPLYLDYCDKVSDVLEKVLYIIYIYSIYANVI